MSKKSRNDILTELYNCGFVRRYLWSVMRERDYVYAEDYEQEIWLILAEMSEDKWDDVYHHTTAEGNMDDVFRYVSGLIRRQVMSDHSRLFYLYHQRQQAIDHSGESMESLEWRGAFDPTWERDQHND